MLAGRSVPEVTLYRNDLLGNTSDLFRGCEADQVGEPRKRGRVPLGRRQATAGGDVEALQRVAIEDRRQTESSLKTSMSLRVGRQCAILNLRGR